EETFDAQFLQSHILRRPEAGKRRKQANRRVLPPVVDSQERWGSPIEIEHAPAVRDVGVAEQLLQETLHRVVRWVVCSFTMHPPKDACRNTLPVFDKGPQSLGMEYKAGSVVRGDRIAAGEESKKALCASIHPQRVPISV